jgi:hypothetical protein
MPTTTMTIAYINPPKPGKQRGSIKGTDGRFLGCFADKFHLFEIGQTYDVEYNEVPMNGTILKTVKSATLIEPEPQPAPQPPPVRRTAASPASASGRTVVGEASPAAAPPASPSTAGNTYRETCPKDAERMFVCSTLNAFIQAGKVHLEPEQLAAATTMLRRLWQYAFNGNGGILAATAAPQQRQERRVVMAAE